MINLNSMKTNDVPKQLASGDYKCTFLWIQVHDVFTKSSEELLKSVSMTIPLFGFYDHIVHIYLNLLVNANIRK